MISMLSTNGETAYGIKEFLADTYNDIQTLSLKTAAAGSKVFCLETMTIYILNSGKEWVELPQQTGGGSVDVDLSDYATIEYVDSQIQLLLNNPDIDINSIADLLQELNKLSVNGGEAFTKLLARIEAIDGDIVDIVNGMQDMAQVNQQQNETLERHDSYLQQIVLGEASYRAQELAPVADEETNYYVRYQNSELDLQRKTDTSITAIGLEENDIVLKKFTGDEMLEAPIQYNHIIENQFIDIGTKKPLCLLGMDDHACAQDDTLRFYLNKANTGHAFFSHSFEIEWKEGYDDGSCIPCVKIGNYYYEVTYARRFPQELKLIGYFSADGVWHNGRRDVDIEYNELIEIVFDLPFAPKEGEYYRAVRYTANYKERVFLYHSYSEHNGVKDGPYGATVTNGEFAMDADLNDTSTLKNKYYIDGHRLISKYKQKQIVSLDELSSGTGVLITGLTPTATNPNFSWGTDDETVYDDATRLGTFTYLVSNRDFNVSTKVHPIGNYGVTKIEGIPVKLDDGSKISFIDASFRGFELSLHSEFYPDENALGKMYIQFITGATATEPERVRHFYRTLVPGWIKVNGENTGLRRTWSPLTEIATSETLKAYDSKIVLLTAQNETFEAQIATLEEQVSTYENKYNELEQQYNALQETVKTLDSIVGKITVLLPSVTVPNEVKLEKPEFSSEYATVVTGTYYPIDATVELDIIITDTSVGDGGQFFRITDQRISDGSYEVTIKNTPNAAGTPHPSAFQATVTANNMTITKTSPITY